jgi:hypothetical protein
MLIDLNQAYGRLLIYLRTGLLVIETVYYSWVCKYYSGKRMVLLALVLKEATPKNLYALMAPISHDHRIGCQVL